MVGDDDDLGVGRLARVEAQAACPPGDDEADVGVGQLVDKRSCRRRRRHVLAFHRDLEMNALGGFVETIDVLLEPEDPARVRPDALEDPVAVEQTMIEDADLGVGFVEQFAADIDLGARAHECGPPLRCGGGRRSGPRVIWRIRPPETIFRFGPPRAERPGRPAGRSADRALPKS